ncbi:MAG TPA: retropepsin-like aspartic protease [Thermoanaerobaculia bacterium]|nr:retropepsin-like aspartic protease [Thermoanaerobaculia bacterium]
MPIYKSAVTDLAALGPSIQVAIGPSRELIAAFAPFGKELSAPHSVTALIDTGAHTTVLTPELAARLRIEPVGKAPISTPSTTRAIMCDRYHVNVYFDEGFVVENVFAIEAPMGGVPYQCLIGRDILRLATLLYDGPENQFALEFGTTKNRG